MILRPAAVLLTLTLIVTGCASTTRPAAPIAAAAAAPAQVEVVRDGANWTATYRFSRPAKAWAFHRSATAAETNQSWRLSTWTVETPGVRLERRGNYDLLVAPEGTVPSQVRVRFRPFSGGMTTSYDPALIFTDGSVALFAGQFNLFPVASAQAAGQLPRDTREIAEAVSATSITFRDARGKVLHAGRLQSAVTPERSDTYVLLGSARPIAECAQPSQGRGVSSGEERDEHRAYYACGTVFGLVAEASSRRPFSAFVRDLIDRNRADRVVTRAEWLDALIATPATLPSGRI